MSVEPPEPASAARLLEPEGFREFYDRALPLVYGYMMRRCGAADTAAELTQETFLSAVRALRSGAAVREPLPWLMSIARGRLVDHFRRAGVRRRLRPPPPTSEEEPLSTHVDSALLNALQSVRNDQRTALLLRYVDDLPLAEVARVLGRSTSATESLLARGRKALAAAYREQEHD